jgi:L-histidine Nalpha-methyltransferase
MSAEMLRICVQPINFLPAIETFRKQVLPIQLDFSSDENLEELNDLRDRLLDDEPVLFSLLGNTAANFEDDIELIARLTRQLLRPRDRILLEVATVSEVNETTARLAAGEYGRSKAFREFTTSALHQHTDLPLDQDGVSFEGAVEGDRAVAIKIIYRNRSQQEHRMTLPDRDIVSFPPDDTIRLYLTRKYDRTALNTALRDVDLTVLGVARTEAPAAARSPYRFGLDLILLSYGGTPAKQTAVQDLFPRSNER